MIFEKNKKVFEKVLNDILGVNINERINDRITRTKKSTLG